MTPGLGITQWGPSGWNILHAMAHTLPPELDTEERVRLRRFLFDFAHFLPCRVCSRHFTEFLRVRATERILSSRKGVVRLLFDAHNDVNIRNGKRKLTMDEYKRMYSLQEESSHMVSNVGVSLSVALCMYFVGRRYMTLKKN